VLLRLDLKLVLRGHKRGGVHRLPEVPDPLALVVCHGDARLALQFALPLGLLALVIQFVALVDRQGHRPLAQRIRQRVGHGVHVLGRHPRLGLAELVQAIEPGLVHRRRQRRAQPVALDTEVVQRLELVGLIVEMEAVADVVGPAQLRQPLQHVGVLHQPVRLVAGRALGIAGQDRRPRGRRRGTDVLHKFLLTIIQARRALGHGRLQSRIEIGDL